MNPKDMLWNAPPPSKAKPRPGELIWTLKNGSRVASCELRYHGEYGVETQFFRDGDFIAGRRFDLRGQALQWAQLERQDLEQEGLD